MKLRFYIDLWPGLDPARYAVFASTQPCAKSEGCKRMAFDVAIPDSLLFGLDAVAPEVSRPELVVDHDDLPGMWDRSDLVGGETDMPANVELRGAERDGEAGMRSVPLERRVMRREPTEKE